jgi:hypothetical protein
MMFCYVPEGSRTPRRFRCQPDLALIDHPHQREQICLELTPVFRSLTLGDSAYGRLSAATDRRITTGASDGAEIGVYGTMLAAQRQANLRTGLADYLRIATTALVTEAD